MTGIKLDFDKAVRETVTLAGQSPLGVFFLMNYVSGFPLTDTIEFVSRDPRQFQIKSDYTIDMGDAESTFWGAFRACFGGRDQYILICRNVLEWLNHNTVLFKGANKDRFRGELEALSKAMQQDAKLFLTEHNNYFKDGADPLKQRVQFYSGHYFDQHAKRDDELLRGQLHKILRTNNTGNELSLTVMCNLLGGLDIPSQTMIPTFIDGFIKNRSTGNLNWKDVMAKIDGGIGGETLGNTLLHSDIGLRLWYAEVTNDQEIYNLILLLHNILFYSDYAGRFTEIVSAILAGNPKYKMAPYAGVYSISQLKFVLENSSQPMSENTARNFADVLRQGGQLRTKVSKEEAFSTIQSHQTSMFSPEVEGRKALTKGSGIS